jgi:predicted nucleic acid-binding protein
VESSTLAVHQAAIVLACDHDLAFHDALIVASARSDMQHGRVIDDVLTMLDPFR